jgi:hypothetical protein
MLIDALSDVARRAPPFRIIDNPVEIIVRSRQRCIPCWNAQSPGAACRSPDLLAENASTRAIVVDVCVESTLLLEVARSGLSQQDRRHVQGGCTA